MFTLYCANPADQVLWAEKKKKRAVWVKSSLSYFLLFVRKAINSYIGTYKDILDASSSSNLVDDIMQMT